MGHSHHSFFYWYIKMKTQKQAKVTNEIIEVFVNNEVTGMDGISILEFIKFRLLSGDLK